ncbi:STAS domain-containing protein [Streptomyces uncialis]|uniref:STAS domain-containing protein n=1 Tax=Streptomyces uncialis TaxID=1048205 RepID=A0A1Q4V9I5_9ACTN|nr:STAS domain-containing protein [Streptomyces uncialis]OKH94512.1 hypothetical protein AB852_09540 [Streptomyces uncialis]
MIRPSAFAHRTTFAPDPATGSDWATIRLQGELDLESGTEFSSTVGLCLACGPAGIRVDLTSLQLMDCTGLRHLEEAAARAREAGVAFSLIGAPPPLVRRVLLLTGSPTLPQPPRTSRTREHPAPDRAVPSRTRHGYWTRILRLCMLTAAGGTIIGSLLLTVQGA